MRPEPWRVFPVQVRALRRLSPSFLRVTFTGAQLGQFADNGFDQRVKLILPVPGRGLADLPSGPDWYSRWRALPNDRRPPVRTYTVRAVRPSSREVDLDMVWHGDAGPASRWASAAGPGAAAAIVGPDAGYSGDHGGIEFRPPPDATAILLGGDETAVPAVASIVERLPPTAQGEVLLEVPYAADELDLAPPPGVRVTWLAREGAPPGARLVPAVHHLLGESPGRFGGSPGRPDGSPLGMAAPADGRVIDGTDDEILWDVPAVAVGGGSYVWMAGEAGVVRALRRLLLGECGLDRRSVALMGYWRLGRSEGS